MASDSTTPNPVGRPSKYESGFCDQVEAAMAEGLSLGAFAGQLGVARSTINEWMENHPEFSEAVSRAKAKRLLHWERRALDVAKEGGGGGAATMVIFGLKNMGGDEWADVQRQELTGKDGGPIQAQNRVDLSALSPDQLRALASIKLPADA
jgi:transcriptional regulator with XRE-family HTH domain